MKLLVETPGAFMLSLMRQEVPWNRPAVVNATQQVAAQVSIGQLKVHYELPDEASDEEFAAWWRECENRELALKSYKAKFEPAAEPEPEMVSIPQKSRGR